MVSADAMRSRVWTSVRASVHCQSDAAFLTLESTCANPVTLRRERFCRAAEETIARHRRVIVAGGTNLYMHALVPVLVSTPPVDPKLRAELEAADDLFERLKEVDPTLASRLHRNDRVRLVRGLGVPAIG